MSSQSIVSTRNDTEAVSCGNDGATVMVESAVMSSQSNNSEVVIATAAGSSRNVGGGVGGDSTTTLMDASAVVMPSHGIVATRNDTETAGAVQAGSGDNGVASKVIIHGSTVMPSQSIVSGNNNVESVLTVHSVAGTTIMDESAVHIHNAGAQAVAGGGGGGGGAEIVTTSSSPANVGGVGAAGAGSGVGVGVVGGEGAGTKWSKNGFGQIVCNQVGKFSKEESELVRKSVQEYCAAKEVTIARLCSECDHKASIKGAWMEISKRLPHRSVQSVYRHALRQLHTFKRGAWTEEEVQTLLSLVSEMGKKWSTIQGQLNRSADSCRDKYREMNDGYVKGRWKEDEIEVLKKIIRDHLNVDPTVNMKELGEMVEREGIQIPWSTISKRMGKRSRLSCFKKWQKLTGLYSPSDEYKRAKNITETTTTITRMTPMATISTPPPLPPSTNTINPQTQLSTNDSNATATGRDVADGKHDADHEIATVVDQVVDSVMENVPHDVATGITTQTTAQVPTVMQPTAAASSSLQSLTPVHVIHLHHHVMENVQTASQVPTLSHSTAESTSSLQSQPLVHDMHLHHPVMESAPNDVTTGIKRENSDQAPTLPQNTQAFSLQSPPTVNAINMQHQSDFAELLSSTGTTTREGPAATAAAATTTSTTTTTTTTNSLNEFDVYLLNQLVHSGANRETEIAWETLQNANFSAASHHHAKERWNTLFCEWQHEDHPNDHLLRLPLCNIAQILLDRKSALVSIVAETATTNATNNPMQRNGVPPDHEAEDEDAKMAAETVEAVDLPTPELLTGSGTSRVEA